MLKASEERGEIVESVKRCAAPHGIMSPDALNDYRDAVCAC